MAERVIWQRQVDYDKIEQRKKNFSVRFAIVAVVVYLAGLFLSGAFIGALVPVVIIGALWGSTVRFQNLSDQANPTIVVDGGILRFGRMEVFIEDVRRYTTMSSKIQTSMFGKYSRIQVCKAIFRLDTPGTRSEPKLVEFGWPNMDEDSVATVKNALDNVLPDRWIAPDELVQLDEMPRRRRHNRGTL